MLSPIAKAQPAELAAALAADHVHASLILLNGPFALGAGLGVGQNPVGVLTFCTVLAQPHAYCLAVHLQLWFPLFGSLHESITLLVYQSTLTGVNIKCII